MQASGQPRPFEVRASYCGGALERSATVRAPTPEAAAAIAVWRGYLPIRCELDSRGLRPLYWDPRDGQLGRWPHPVAVFPLGPDHCSVRLVFGDEGQRTLVVEARLVG